MKTHHALRYLFLRFLTKERDRVSKELFDEVARSLHVEEKEDGSFLLRWRHKSQEFQQLISASEVEFYQKGDHSSSTGAEGGLARKNPRSAQAWAAEALGLPARNLQHRFGELFPWWKQECTGYFLMSALVLAFGGRETLPFVCSVLAYFGLEYLRNKGAPFVPALLILLGWWLPGTAMLASLGFALCSFLNPNPVCRGTKVALSLLAAAALLVWGPKIAGVGDWSTLAILLPVLLFAFILRWLRGSHVRSLPLVLPCFSLGLLLDGQTTPAYIVAGAALAGALFVSYGYPIFPVQKERTLSPNG